MDGGHVPAIYIGPRFELPQPVERVEAHAGKGLQGNRYYWEGGGAPAGNALTLIAAEALDAFTEETGIPLSAQESRRNVVTRGLDLNALVGKRFRVGNVECLGIELCEPCDHLQAMTPAGRPERNGASSRPERRHPHRRGDRSRRSRRRDFLKHSRRI